jgi:hypothetical protein
MEKKKTLPGLGEVYRQGWKASLRLWPLMAVQFTFALFRYVTLLGCVLILFGPLLQKDAAQALEGLKDPQSFNWSPILSDWVSYCTSGGWMALMAGLVLLYLIWWSLLTAVSDAGLFRSFLILAQSGEGFSLGTFFKEGIRLMVPMILLQVWLSFFVMAYLGGLCLVGGMGYGLYLVCGSNGWILAACIVFLGIPLALVSLLLGLFFAIFSLAAKAYVGQGLEGPRALKSAWGLCRREQWRMPKALGLVYAVYFGSSMLLRLFLGLLSLLPFIGILFSLLDILLGVLMVLALGLYAPALSVGFLAEAEE